MRRAFSSTREAAIGFAAALLLAASCGLAGCNGGTANDEPGEDEAATEEEPAEQPVSYEAVVTANGQSASIENRNVSASEEGQVLLAARNGATLTATSCTGFTAGAPLAVASEDSTLAISGCDLTGGYDMYNPYENPAGIVIRDQAAVNIRGGSLTTHIGDGAVFVFEDADASLSLTGMGLAYYMDSADLMHVTGTSSANVTTANQDLYGDVVVDEGATLKLSITEATEFSGSVCPDNPPMEGTTVTMTVGSGSKWIVSKDSRVTNLTVAPDGAVVDREGKTATIMQGNMCMVEGEGPMVVMVSGSYGVGE